VWRVVAALPSTRSPLAEWDDELVMLLAFALPASTVDVFVRFPMRIP
jgi:hypothetical protein